MTEPPDQDPAQLIESVVSTLMQVLTSVVHEHVPPEHRAAVLRHLSMRINLELRVRTFIESARTPPRQDDD